MSQYFTYIVDDLKEARRSFKDSAQILFHAIEWPDKWKHCTLDMEKCSYAASTGDANLDARIFKDSYEDLYYIDGKWQTKKKSATI